MAATSSLVGLRPASAEESDSDASISLTQEQREEKRLLFNQYVEEETTRREREKYRAKPAQKKQKIWVAKFSSLYGYDSNVNFNSSRRGDGYFQETLSGSVKIGRPDVPWIPWDGRLGLSGYLDFFNYENFERSSYQTSLVSVFTEEKILENLQLKLAYELNGLRYPENNQLGYLGHRFKPTLTYFSSKTSSISVFATGELRDYGERRALDASNRPSGGGRVDHYAEIGLNPKFYPNGGTYISLTAAAKFNDSNDIYRDYNDYAGWKASLLLYQKIHGPLSVAGVAGYDFKQYEGLTFSTAETGPSETQADSLFYGGIYAYYTLSEIWQAVASYLYKQNVSNNPLLDWTGYTTSLGLNLTF